MNKKFKHELKVGSITVVQQAEGNKKNPNSLRFLIGHIVNAYFAGNIVRAVEELAPFGGRYIDDKINRPPKSINDKNLPKILRDEIHIAYWHIEIFARFLGLPSGVFIIISREISYYRYDMGKEASPLFVSCMETFVSSMKKTIEGRDRMDEDLLKKAVEKAAEAFRPLREHDQSTPMLF